ncbi:hypothetical protein OB2597_06700 [Pseudooceanicola batsensis HTCC2597]|uniref:Uncharacterized protein n=1 Tax=Pseudooceanicola batsensis (strain ATCC BAA-863 / DSM 15984 / KCTC 12145 / HTCC2597) TaxID=252305 RepID=A3TTH5_PSEBH|nr:hypothetical protein [Pseudooceanicola batsensis]EAQ04952.1 hypothetical protein OB2597_06700 [Pseudooceanicola batsensis HTCC2597]
MDEDEATEIRQGFLNLRNDWLRRRIFNAASTYLVLEAIQQRGEDRDTALAAHEHRIAEYDRAESNTLRAKQFQKVLALLREKTFIGGIKSSLLQYRKK